MEEIHKSTLHKLAYLQALGVPSYVSRRQAPGAAPSRRLVVVRKEQVAPAMPKDTAVARPLPRDASAVSLRGTSPAEPPARTGGAVSPASATAQSGAQADSCSFSLVAMLAGRWLWLEGLGDMPLASDQVNLVQAMAHALGFRSSVEARVVRDAASPHVSTFNWPMHSNRQLDSGIDAAKASLAAFLERRIEQQGCVGIVLLGDECARWVETTRLEVPAVTIASTAQMLQDPELKRQAWRALQPLAMGAAAGRERA
mgnify:CR=1 FL=1|tara:strand:+ start:3673 stop:4440 length:768 start_codon:yes stop_codon:yes gene_type:complete